MYKTSKNCIYNSGMDRADEFRDVDLLTRLEANSKFFGSNRLNSRIGCINSTRVNLTDLK